MLSWITPCPSFGGVPRKRRGDPKIRKRHFHAVCRITDFLPSAICRLACFVRAFFAVSSAFYGLAVDDCQAGSVSPGLRIKKGFGGKGRPDANNNLPCFRKIVQKQFLKIPKIAAQPLTSSRTYHERRSWRRGCRSRFAASSLRRWGTYNRPSRHG